MNVSDVTSKSLFEIAKGRGPLSDRKLKQAQDWIDEDWESKDVDSDAVKLIKRLLITVESMRAFGRGHE